MTTMTERKGEAAKSHYIEKMGPELGTQFYHLWEEFLWLAIKWGEYIALFDTGPKCVDLLNEAAPTFFWMVEKVFWDDMLLHIARLTDPSESMGRKDKKNLTIQNLPGLVSDPAIKAASDQLVSIADKKVEFCRDWRNRRLAHSDLDLAINIEPARPLEHADKEKVVEALNAIRDVLMALEQSYMAADSVFVGSITQRGATDLLSVIHFGIKEQARANERIRVGQATEDDYPALKLRG
ncbi:MAG: hypothetical protein ACLQB4_10575 [Beijerinckiaceae bacterium]